MGEARRRNLIGLPPRNTNQQQIQVNLDDAQQRQCTGCGCKYFITVITVHTVSAIISPIGKELTAQQSVLVCLECKKLLTLQEEVPAS